MARSPSSPATSVRRKALVIGGSLGGLFAANLLWRAGWDVHVCERVGEALAGRGAGIVAHDELLAALESAGASVDETIGCVTHLRVTLDRDGTVIAQLPMRQLLTAWGRVYRLLKDAFPGARYHFDKSLESVDAGAESVKAWFGDGTALSCDLLVGADGIRSTVRSQFLPDARPAYAGYVAWRGLVEESSLSGDTRRVLSDCLGFCLPPGEQMLGYLVAGPDNTVVPGARRYNFVWYRPVDEALELPSLLTDAAGIRHEMNIPPDRIRPEVIAAMRADAERLLAPQFAEIVRVTAHPFFQPIYDLESPALVSGRIALLGDAAFVARPHVGMGVTKAAGDAVALVEELARTPDDIDLALRAYEQRRLRLGQAVVARGRELGLGIGARPTPGTDTRTNAQLTTPEFVMRTVAVTP